MNIYSSYAVYTRHGKAIPGATTTVRTSVADVSRVFCEGFARCESCNIDAANYWLSKTQLNVTIGTPGYHDVIMIAFDIRGASAKEAHRELMHLMPDPNNFDWMDSWWVANDERFDGTDTDSAVFVRQGQQPAARKLLRDHGLVD